MNASASRWAMPAVGSSSREQARARLDDRRQVHDPARARREVAGEMMAEPLQPERLDDAVDGSCFSPSLPARAHGSCSVVASTLTRARASSHSIRVSCTVSSG